MYTMVVGRLLEIRLWSVFFVSELCFLLASTLLSRVHECHNVLLRLSKNAKEGLSVCTERETAVAVV